MLLEGCFKLQVAHLITTGVIVEQAVETDAFHAGNETACGSEGLQTATGAYAHHGQRAVLITLLAGRIVYVGKSVKFVGYYVDVVTAYAMALASNALAFVSAGYSMKFTALNFTLTRVKVGCHCIHTGRIAHKHYLVGQLLWLEMQMKTGAVSIDDEL